MPIDVYSTVMGKGNSNKETEIKLRVADLSALRRRLKQLRAREVSPRTYEFNTLYDTREKVLFRHGKLVRIRIEHPCSNGSRKLRLRTGRTTLTCKGPFESTRARRITPGNRRPTGGYKVRQEFEVLVADAEQMRLILSMLGLRPVFRYEKFRTTYVLPGSKDLKIEFDETPIGLFLELEGRPAAIDRAASLLGYTRREYVTQSYGALHIAHSRRHGLKAHDMLFRSSRRIKAL